MSGGSFDWPVGVIVSGAVVALLLSAVLGLLLVAFGVAALLIRRGAFTPRR